MDTQQNHWDKLLKHLHRGGRYGCWFIKPQYHTFWKVGSPALVPLKCDVWYGVNPLTTKIRSIDTVAAINCVFADMDAKDFDGGKDEAFSHVMAIKPFPSIVIDSGGGYHCYWLFRGPFVLSNKVERDRAKSLQKRWVGYVGGDPSASDISRLLRVPGTQNYKYDDTPTVEFVLVDLDKLYSVAELVAIVGEDAPRTERPTRKDSDFSIAEDVAAAVVNLSKLTKERCDNYGTWLHVGMALEGLGVVGLELWEEWSHDSKNWEEGICEEKWKTFDAERSEEPQTLASLGQWAKDDNPNSSPRERRDDASEETLIGSSPTEWEIFTLRDAYAPRPPLVYAVEGLFAMPSMSIVYGAPGTLKSMLLADMAVCVAVGRDWLPAGDEGGWRKATTETPTLWLDFDNGKRRTHERMEALAMSRGLPEDARFHYVSMPTPWLDGSSENDVVGLVQLVESLEVGLVIVDNLRVVSGKGDENSAEMAEVMTGFRRLAEDSGAAVVLVHHQRKGNAKDGGRLGDSLRGHSSIEASIDLALLVTREGDSDTINVTSTKTRGVDVLPFGAQFFYEHRPDTQELQAAYFEGAQVKTRTGIAYDAILSVVDDSPGINKTTLIETVNNATGFGINYLRKCIDQLVKDGRLRAEDGQKNATFYFVVG